MHEQNDSADGKNSQIINLFEFVKRFNNLRSKKQLTYDNFKAPESVVYFHELDALKQQSSKTPKAFELLYTITHTLAQQAQQAATQNSNSSQQSTRAQNINPDLWVDLKKPKLRDAPVPSEQVELWFTGDWQDYNTSELIIKNSIPSFETDESHFSEPGDTSSQSALQSTKLLTDDPKLKLQVENYIQKWQAWASERLALEPIQNMYDRLFRIYQKAKHDGDAYEALLVVGLLHTSNKSSKPVRRHIVATPCEFSIDNAKTGTLKIKPTEDGVKFRLEAEDVFNEADLPSINTHVVQELETIENDFWLHNELKNTLRSWINDYHPKAQFSELVKPSSTTASIYDNTQQLPVLYFAPALVFRKRSHRSFRDFCSKAIQKAKTDASASAMKALHKNGSAFTKVDRDTPPLPVQTQPATPLFPLPSNKQQRQIINEHIKHPIIVVQGPPGTGKTHSIANVVSHLLAEGKKILVTSEKDRALGVLKSKLPQNIQNLCVEVLGRDASAFSKLKQPIESINSEKQHYNSVQTKHEVQKQKQRLARLKQDKQKIQDQIKSVHSFELHKYTNKFKFYSGTAACIADQVKKQKPDYAWIGEYISAKQGADKKIENFAKNLSNAHAREYIHKIKGLKHDLEALNESVKFIEQLLTPHQFKALCQEEANINKTIQIMQGRINKTSPEEQNSNNLLVDHFSVDEFKQLHEQLRRVNHAIEDIQSRPSEFAWAQKALNECLSGHNDQVWSDRQKQLQKYLQQSHDIFKQADALENRINRSTLSPLKPVDEVLRALQELVHKCNAQNKLPLLTRFSLPKYIQNMRVDGAKPHTLTQLHALQTYFKAQQQRNAIKDYIKVFVLKPINSFRLSEFASQIKDAILEPIVQCVEVFEAMREIEGVLKKHPHIESLVPTPEKVQAAWHNVDIQHRQHQLKQKKNRLELMTKVLQIYDQQGNQLAQRIRLAVEQKDAASYESAHQSLLALYGEQRVYHDIKDVLNTLNTKLIDVFWQSRSDTLWAHRLSHIEQALAWQQASMWLEYHNQQDLEVLEDQLLSIEENSLRQTEKLVQFKSWAHCLEHITAEQLSSLKQFSESVNKIGKGTGKSAHKHRSVAQQALQTCGDVVPAWVMPLSRVVEFFNPNQHKFDVVIIDEASQTGPNGFLLHALAEKIIVIGDNEQISPENIGLQSDDVDTLIKKHLKDFKGSQSIGRDYSYYDWCHINFSSAITLTEHFRCAPEIIEFSNKISYVGKKLCAMKSLCSNRLKPLETFFVKNAEATGKTSPVNKAEAQAIVNKIAHCIADARYKNKTFGIISLQGRPQVQCIENELNRIDIEEREKRQIRVGDAYDFQGDERDVMLLSLAIDNNWKATALTHDRFKKRYNVAASRAKEQVWLFYSVDKDSLNPKCFRAKFLDHCLNYTHPSKFNPQLINLVQQEDDRVQHKQPNNAPDPFDSWMEARVFCTIAKKGYKVIPQFEVAGFKIDLVVQGEGSQLAIECDGDIYHAEEHEAYDEHRQSVLERCGWRFWRCRSSVFYADREQALEPLWKKLDELKIYPLQSTQSSPPPAPLTPASPKSSESSAPPTSPIDNLTQPTQSSDSDSDSDPSLDSSSGLNIDASLNSTQAPISEPSQQLSFPDPRSSSKSEVAATLYSLIQQLGPVVVSDLYRQYAKKAGIASVGRVVKKSFDKSLHYLINVKKQVVLDNEGVYTRGLNGTVYPTGTPSVQVRNDLDRDLEAIPLRELKHVMDNLERQHNLTDAEEIFRQVLSFYNRSKLTSKAKERLTQARGLLSPEPPQ